LAFKFFFVLSTHDQHESTKLKSYNHTGGELKYEDDPEGDCEDIHDDCGRLALSHSVRASFRIRLRGADACSYHACGVLSSLLLPLRSLIFLRSMTVGVDMERGLIA
jgi:hypothetical protein